MKTFTEDDCRRIISDVLLEGGGQDFWNDLFYFKLYDNQNGPDYDLKKQLTKALFDRLQEELEEDIQEEKYKKEGLAEGLNSCDRFDIQYDSPTDELYGASGKVVPDPTGPYMHVEDVSSVLELHNEHGWGKFVVPKPKQEKSKASAA